jgi:hypothetical protein
MAQPTARSSPPPPARPPESWRRGLTGGAPADERRGLLQIVLAAIILRLCLMPFFGHVDVLSEARRIHYFWENQIWFDLNSARSVSNFIQLLFYSVTRWLMPDPAGLFYLRDVAASTATFQEFFAFSQTPGAWRALFLIKVPFLFMDLATLVVLWHCVSGAAERRRMAWWWLFNPITLFAYYIFGRFEAIPVFFVTVMIWALLRQRWMIAALGLALAANGRETFALLLPLFVLFFLNPGLRATLFQRLGSISILAVGGFLALNLHTYLGIGGGAVSEGSSVMGEDRGISLIGFALYWFSVFVFAYGLLALWLFSHPLKQAGEAGLFVLLIFWFAFFAFTTTTSHFTAWMVVFPLLAAARNPVWTRPLLAFFFIWAAKWAFMTDAGVFTQWLFVPFSLHWTEIPSIPHWYQSLFEGRTFLTLTFVIWCWQTLFVAVLTYLGVLAWKDYRRRTETGGGA